MKILLVLLFATFAFAQHDKVKMGPNFVTVTARHCQNHVYQGKDGKWAVDAARCAADPSTVYYEHSSHNLDTNAAKDYAAFMMSGTSGAPTAGTGNFLALSTNGTIAATDCAATATPASSNCTLASEVTTASLGRHAAVFTRTGNGTYTLGFTWTATGSVANILSAAIVNNATPGTGLVLFENTFSSISPNSGDTIQLTWTVTIT